VVGQGKSTANGIQIQRLWLGAERLKIIPSREQSSGRGSRTKGSHGPSLSFSIAKWTKKVSGFACGATLDATQSPPEQRAQTFTSNHSSSLSSNHSNQQLQLHQQHSAGGNGDHHQHDHSTSMAIDKKASRTAPASASASPSSSYKSSTSHKANRKGSPEDYDHHTLATAATASATISYSTDQGDDASEMGMEVIMSSSNSSHDQVGVEPYVSHSFPAGKHTFVVDKRYTMIRTIGSGAYGVVISATDAKTQSNVAVKMVPKAFSDEIDAKRILREIKLLKHFDHENIIGLLDMMPPNVKYVEDFKDVYLVTDLMETDLHRIIYSKQKLSIDHAQYFIYQVLRGLKYIHSCRVLHRDLKPSNLLVNSNCDLKICDFGLARGLHKDPADPSSLGSSDSGTLLLTEYVVTRWYRAPEIMLACHEYSYQIDVWSVGCILAELILRKPYFPGDDYIDQVRRRRQPLPIPSRC
jgi:tRNA A-37 threonylcarbamoyl transferase component Bud32